MCEMRCAIGPRANNDTFYIIYSCPLFFARGWGIIKLLIQINTLQLIYY